MKTEIKNLRTRYKKFLEIQKNLPNDKIVVQAKELLYSYRDAGKIAADPDTRAIITNDARKLGEFIYKITGEFPLVRLEKLSVAQGFVEAIDQQTPKPGFLLPYPRNNKFIGRHDFLIELHDMLQLKEQGNRITMLYGIGGIGKTELAKEYAYRYANAYPGGIYWIDSINDWFQEFARIADQIGLHSDENNKNIRNKNLISRFLAFLQFQVDALIIIDNVRDVSQLQQVTHSELLSKIPCQVLFTIRLQEPDPTYHCFEVKMFSPDEALQALVEETVHHEILNFNENTSEKRAARVICRELGGHPLILRTYPKIARS